VSEPGLDVGNEPADEGGAPAGAQVGRVRRAWHAWRHWRRTRPFWGGLLVLLGGAEILLSERAPLPLVIHIGLQGLAGYLVPLISLLCGALLWFHPVQRTFYSLLAVLLALGSWITSNLGGFFIGMLLGVIGGALAFGWADGGWPRRAWHLPWRPRRAEPSAGPIPDGSADGAAGPAGPSAGAHQEPASGEPRLGQNEAGQDHGAGQDGAGQDGPQQDQVPAAEPDAWVPWGDRWLTRALPVGPIGLAILLAAGHAAAAAPNPVISGPEVAADAGSLSARLVSVTGLSFDGVAQVPTVSGTLPMLKFTMSTLTLAGGPGLAFGQPGHFVHTRAASLGFTGHITLYTTEITGDLHGLAVIFTPRRPPSGLTRVMRLTNVVAEQPCVSADSVAELGLGTAN
jgi:hypothetical protein